MSDASCDVVVVGGGLVGAALAYELVADGVDCVLVDEHHPGRATDAGAGILSPETTWNPDKGWFSFGMAAGRHYRTLVQRLAEDGADETGFAECGMLMLAVDPGEDDWFATCAEQTLARAPGVVTEVTPDEARRLCPPLGEIRRAVHNPAGARVDGRLMTAALLRGADRHGLRRLETAATGLVSEGGRVVGIESGAGTLSCGAVAIAGGAWSTEFGRQLGVTIPVTPVKGQIVHMQLPETAMAEMGDSARWPIAAPVLTHYLVAWPGGRVACGGTYEADAGFDTGPTVAALEELLRGCLTLAPGLARASVTGVRVGLRPVTPDGAPVLGAVPGSDNVHLVTGHGTEGLLLGPYSAALVAQSLTGGSVDEQLRQFSVERFSA